MRGASGVFLVERLLARAELFSEMSFSPLSGVAASRGLLPARVDVGVEPKRNPKVTSCTSVVLGVSAVVLNKCINLLTQCLAGASAAAAGGLFCSWLLD
jgi:hypothetical protein